MIKMLKDKDAEVNDLRLRLSLAEQGFSNGAGAGAKISQFRFYNF